MIDEALTGIVFNIQHFTVHDGPGIRTEIFLKGCPLQCKWCSNPESIKQKQQIGVHGSRCIGVEACGYCLKACPESDPESDPKSDIGIFVIDENKVTAIDRNLCTDCLKCAEVCPADALSPWGNIMSVKDVMAEVMADVDFYEKSKGGVTLSGGDPLIQWPFTLEILKACKAQNIHTCLETELHCKNDILEKVLAHTDMVITDIKHMDEDCHRQYTGVGNSLILANLIKTVDMGMPVVIRIPVIPGHNNDEDNIRATAGFILNKLHNKVIQVQLLPYRPLGIEKYQSLSMEYPMAEFSAQEPKAREKDMLNLVSVLQSNGIPAVVGANSKY